MSEDGLGGRLCDKSCYRWVEWALPSPTLVSAPCSKSRARFYTQSKTRAPLSSGVNKPHSLSRNEDNAKRRCCVRERCSKGKSTANRSFVGSDSVTRMPSAECQQNPNNGIVIRTEEGSCSRSQDNRKRFRNGRKVCYVPIVFVFHPEHDMWNLLINDLHP